MNAIDTGPPPGGSPPLPAKARSRWPVLLGVVSIAFGGLGLTCYGCQSAGTLLAPLMAPQTEGAPSATFVVFSAVDYCGASMLSAWLLVAGIGLCMRKRWAARATSWWAVVKLAFTLVITIVTFPFLGELADRTMKSLEEARVNLDVGVTETLMAVWTIIGALFAMAWPLFLMIWFGRRSVQREVESW